MLEIERSMRETYAPQYRAWKEQLAAWDARKKAAEDAV